MEDSIFTKIIKGVVPSHKVYEDDQTLAFLDIFPAVHGQAVVVPKTQVEFVWDLDDETYTALMLTANKVAKRLREVLGTKYVGVKIEGVDVPHAHVKLYPFNTVAEYNAQQDMSAEPDHEALSNLSAKLAF
ncbi:HIT domain-containing protein [Candidatus Saccharibacteria bacterium]|nr:HIT domain-containing protein [Candidatus Saccharibacteria bacterium]